MSTRIAPRHRQQVPADGADGNERLTAMTGAVLLLGFAVEGLTILAIHQLLWMHLFVGALLIGPVLLKMGSTIYRFARYYSGSRPYVRKGPPAPLLRLLGPFVIITSVAVLGTGVMLGIAGPGSIWLFLHKATFVLWFGVMTIHVLNYAPRLPRLLSARPHYDGQLLLARGRSVRWLALVLSLAAGIGIAAVCLQMSGKWGITL